MADQLSYTHFCHHYFRVVLSLKEFYLQIWSLAYLVCWAYLVYSEMVSLDYLHHLKIPTLPVVVGMDLMASPYARWLEMAIFHLSLYHLLQPVVMILLVLVSFVERRWM